MKGLTGQEKMDGGEAFWMREESQIFTEEKPLSVDYQQAHSFLTILDEEAEGFTFQTFDENKERKDPKLTKVLNGSFDEHKDQLTLLNKQGAGVYVTVNETDLKGRKKENINSVRAVFQEDDGEGKDLPVTPHIVTNTSPGHFHRYILVDSLENYEFEQVMEVMVSDYGSDPSAKDLCRVLRLPGFFHTKDPSNLFQVRITQQSNELPYSGDEVKRLFPSNKKETFEDFCNQPDSADIEPFIKQILSGDVYHTALLRLTAHYIGSGNSDRSTAGTLQALMQQASVKDKRWEARYQQIPDLVKSAIKKYRSDNSVETETNIETPDWPVLSRKALPGIVGEFVRLATENSEADPAAVLATFLTRFAVEVGAGPHMWIGDTAHRARLATVIVGASSKARKGTSGKPVKRLFNTTGPIEDFTDYTPAQSTPGPFSSGEGIIHLIRDEIKKYDKELGDFVVTDPGVSDKRLFVLDEEFSGVMAQTKREGNTLSMIIRQIWDSGNLAPIIKNNRTIATGGHVGWVSHITLYELNARLGESEAFNGFSNRILWVCAKRQQLVAWPEPMDTAKLNIIQAELFRIIATVNKEVVIRPDALTRNTWSNKYYQQITRSRPGLLGAVINRAEAQTLRLAMIYCLLDGKTTIELQHLESALAFWDYCEQSARFIFHNKSQDKVARKILDELKNSPKTGTEIHRVFGNNITKDRLETAITELLAAGRITKNKQKTGLPGAPTITYSLDEKNELNEINMNNEPKAGINSFNSFNSSRGDENVQDEWEDIDEC